jgi:predicted ATPase/DNA-binding SARP family transcriptional activator
VLALLATAEGRAVPVDDLLDALWPTDLPDSARSTLQSHVSRLRRHLAPAAARLEGSAGAYRLVLGPAGTDVARVRRLLAEAESLLTAGGTEPPSPPAPGREPGATEALALLDAARALWRGAPLHEFADVAPLAATAVRLVELGRSVDDAHVRAALAAGQVDVAVEGAAAAVAAEPLAEPAALLLVRALHTAGRSADALRAGYDFRRRLVDATGLDPSPALGRLEADVAGTARAGHGGGIPRSPHRMRGRDAELAALQRLVESERLVTVIGPGGVGKTRLAAEVAGRIEPAGAALLAPVTSAAAIPDALAAGLGLQVGHGDVIAACAALLAAGPRLLLVDNCEHLLAGVRDVVAHLLDACPGLTVLATSRAPLGLPAEQRFRLAPLAVTRPRGPDDVARSPAVALFVDRARRVRPDFAPDAARLDQVADIVQRLDGMPLAIELAAGRLSSLGLDDLHDRLDRALDLLDDGETGLRRTIAWSYDLLPGDEQRLLRHLAVFPDGVDLATAEFVAHDLGLGPGADRALAHLVDASMVEAQLDPTTRYRMLDTVRAYAHDRRRAAGDEDAAQERFVTWAVERADQIGRLLDTPDEARADGLMRRELANLRAAWRRVRDEGRLDDAVRLVVGLQSGSGWRDLTEVWTWGRELAADPAVEQHPAGAEVLGIAAASAWSRGELDDADRLARRGLALGGDGTWRCEGARALVALSRGDWPAAIRHGLHTGEQAPRPQESYGIAALAAAYQGDLATAADANERLAATTEASPTLQAFHRYVAGEIDAAAGRPAAAVAHYRAAIAGARVAGATFLEGVASVGLLTVRAGSEPPGGVLAGYGELVDYWERTGAWVQQWTTLRNLARFLRALGDPEAALFLDAAADHAPDAPPVAGPRDGSGLAPAEVDRIVAAATAASRGDVLAAARAAIRQPGRSPRPTRR